MARSDHPREPSTDVSASTSEADLVVSERIWTIPNALSVARLLGVPVFLWLILTGHIGWAVVVLVLSVITDLLDGMIARRFGQITRLGQVLDPVADRLFILSTLLGMWWVEALPTWFIVGLLLRDVAGSVVVAGVRRAGYRGLPVHDIGKAGTFCLLASFPVLLLAHRLPAGGADSGALAVGWGLALWGFALYWIGLLYYARQARALTGGDLS